jgi:hypothetical protein
MKVLFLGGGWGREGRIYFCREPNPLLVAFIQCGMLESAFDFTLI